jgi:predicted ATPase
MHQVALEDHLFDTTTPHRLNEFVVLDRGLYDNVAYIRRIPEHIQNELYRRFGDKYRPIANIHHAISRIQKLAEGRHHFYDLVIILKTTGYDQTLYEKLKASNPARYETADEAIEIEERIVESYLTAKKMGLIKDFDYINTLDLDEKIELTLQSISKHYKNYLQERKSMTEELEL